MARNQNNETQEVINTGAGTELPVSIEDGQGASGLKAKVAVDGDGDNRLFVDIKTSPGNPTPVIPVDDALFFKKNLENGGSHSLVVNGDTTPVVFSVGPPAGQTWYVESMQIAVGDSGTCDPQDFGAISNGLTNGVLIELLRDGTPYQIDNIKHNIEMVTAFHEHKNTGGQNTSAGWLNTGNLYLGTHHFSPPMILQGDDSDLFQVTIRDDLNDPPQKQLDFFEIACWAWRVL